MKKITGFVLLLFFAFLANAQSSISDLRPGKIAYSRKIVDTLSSPFFWGRGYTNNGMHKAAEYICNYFKGLGLQQFNNSYTQQYSYNVNSFPGNMSVTINGEKLKPGVDYLVSPESVGNNTDGKLEVADTNVFINKKNRVFIEVLDKLTWSVEQSVKDYTLIQVKKSAIQGTPKKYEVDIENKLIENFKAANITGFVKGTLYPDSFLFITAHYDHLGGMGRDTYFPGANDNASGIALLLNLAAYYSEHPQPYSIGFICFSGEEIGLLGSKYYTEHPLIPLKKIKFLLNTDLAGTGVDGITVVNASEYTAAFALLNTANYAGHYVIKINARGKAANSDHYFFSEKGVPAFFFYTLGGIAAYHDVFDKSSTLPLNEQEDLYKLIIDFYDLVQTHK